jgi:esterase/lipase superfamily enzyme
MTIKQLKQSLRETSEAEHKDHHAQSVLEQILRQRNEKDAQIAAMSYVLFIESYVLGAAELLNELLQRGDAGLAQTYANVWNELKRYVPGGLNLLSETSGAFAAITALLRNVQLQNAPELAGTYQPVFAATNTMRELLGTQLSDELTSATISLLSHHPLPLKELAGRGRLPAARLLAFRSLAGPVVPILSEIAGSRRGASAKPPAPAPPPLDYSLGPEPELTAAVGKMRDPAAEKSLDTHLYRVWYGTNRAPADSADLTQGFSNERDKDGTVHYGTCTVSIPKTHSFGSTGTPWWKRWTKLKFEDDHLKIVARKGSSDPDHFFSEVRQEIEALAAPNRQIMVYLHGFCNSFNQAAIRAAQMGFDLKVAGITAFFSWPSCASLGRYFADADRIAASESAITAFLVRLSRDTAAEAVHIIAHSMGNRGLARSIQRITADVSMSGVRFGQIILAAPDIEVSLFRDLAAVYPKISRRTTMYVSARDRALGMSKWLQDSDRAGFTPPVTVVPDIDTIEVTNIDLTMLGHGYYAEAESVLHDMFDVLSFDAPPDKRQRIHPAGGGPQPAYWVIGK